MHTGFQIKYMGLLSGLGLIIYEIQNCVKLFYFPKKSFTAVTAFETIS